MDRECSITGCTNQHGDALVMCYDHWRTVPPDLKAAIAAVKRGAAGYAVAVYRAIQYAGAVDGR